MIGIHWGLFLLSYSIKYIIGMTLGEYVITENEISEKISFPYKCDIWNFEELVES
jgi:hypothetical protein